MEYKSFPSGKFSATPEEIAKARQDAIDAGEDPIKAEAELLALYEAATSRLEDEADLSFINTRDQNPPQHGANA